MINETFITLFYKKLNLSEFDEEVQTSFLASLTKYLDHGRKDVINGRTYEYVERQLDKFIYIMESLDFSFEEIVKILTVWPSILNNPDDLYHKYLFLGIVEDDENKIRRFKLLTKPKDFMVSLQKLYARYKLVCESGYEQPTWNNIVHCSDKEFASLFVKGKYEKNYQIFENSIEVMQWLANVDINDLDMEEVKHWSVNREIVMKYEGKKEDCERKY